MTRQRGHEKLIQCSSEGLGTREREKEAKEAVSWEVPNSANHALLQA